MTTTNSPGRPRPQVPEGYTTITDAATATDMAYCVVYARVRSGVIASKKIKGVVLIPLTELPRLIESKRVKADPTRYAAQFRITPEQHARWHATAAAAEKSLNAWLASLADAASAPAT